MQPLKFFSVEVVVGACTRRSVDGGECLGHERVDETFGGTCLAVTALFLPEALVIGLVPA